MKFFVNDACIGCGACNDTCPQVFDMTDEGVAKAIDAQVEERYIAAARQAMADCPVNAISEI